MNMQSLIRRHSVATYFGLAFLISWGGGLIVMGPKLVRGEAIQSTDALLLFPVLVVGVGIVGIVLTRVVDGIGGLRDLWARMRHGRVGAQWYALALLIPPVLIVGVLTAFRTFVSPVFAPGFFPIGILFGVVPGFFEEIGWTGYVFPRMQASRSPLAASLLLGVLWGLWHMPVVDYLGAAAPHGAYWLPFFLAFIALVTAMRGLISWIYSNTQSILLAQLMHFSFTGCLVLLSPAHTSPVQETLWYAVYAAVLWIVVGVVMAAYGKRLARQPIRAGAI